LRKEGPSRLSHEGILALLFCAKDDKIPSLLVINSITNDTSHAAYCKLLLCDDLQVQSVGPGRTIVAVAMMLLLNTFAVLE